MEFFKTENIVKRYANHLALDNVSISVPEKSIFGLLGPNGAGKTTLIRIINQITGPDSGEVTFNGEKLNSSHIAQIGYLPEERGLYKKMKVGEQALYMARLKGIPKNIAIKRLKEWFERFEIQTWWDKKVEELSKGMAQKVQFIVTVLHEPKLLIFDEPFSGFDPINVNLLKNEILQLRDKGATIIFSTHNMGSVEELCDHIALINKSKTILQGSIDDIRNTYKSNIFEVVYAQNFNKIQLALSGLYEILEINPNGKTTSVRIRLALDASTNKLISHLLLAGDILSFKESIPTMNEIFIKQVEGNKPENQTEVETETENKQV